MDISNIVAVVRRVASRLGEACVCDLLRHGAKGLYL